MNISEVYNENIFMGNISKESYNYENIKNTNNYNDDSEIFGSNYGKDYYKSIYESKNIDYKAEEKKVDKSIYTLIKYDDDIYTNLINLESYKDEIKLVGKVLCIPTVDDIKIIKMNLPYDTENKKCIIQGNFMFKFKYSINENSDEIYEKKVILPFSKSIIIPIYKSSSIKVSVKLEDYYLRKINSHSLIVSSSALFIIYATDLDKHLV